MKLIILIAAISAISFNAWAQDESCAKKSIVLNGNFGKYKSPLLDQWSMSSGNFTGIEIKSKEKISKVLFVFKDREGTEMQTSTLSLQKNRTENFDFNKMVNSLIIHPNTLTIKLTTNNGVLCSQDMIVIERDGQDGVLKKL